MRNKSILNSQSSILNLIILSFLIAMVGCSSDDSPSSPITPVTPKTWHDTAQEEPTVPTWTQTTDNIADEMYVEIDSLNVPDGINAGDMLAAFAGSECWGVATPETSSTGRKLFRLIIQKCADDGCTAGDQAIELRCYSASKKHIHKATITYKTDDRLGSAIRSYETEWSDYTQY